MEFLKEVWYKIKNVILNPSEFFEEVKEEKEIKKPFLYFATITIVPVIVMFIGLFLNIKVLSREVPIPFSSYTIPLITYVGAIITTFIFAGIIHIFAILLKGSGDYTSTYKSVVYGATPGTLLGWIPFIGVIPNIYGIYLQIKGLSSLHDVSMLRAFAVWILPIVIITGLIVGVALLYLGVLFSGSFTLATSQIPTGIGEVIKSSVV